MRRRPVALAAVFGAVLLDLVACNTISGVGDFTFGTSSTSASSGVGGSTSTAGGAAGSTSSGGGSGGGGLTVRCPNKPCPVAPDAGACCWDNPTEFPTPAGRCVDGPPVSDGCITEDLDGGRETRIECSRPGDCTKAFCCANYGGVTGDAGWYELVTCAKVCDPTENQRVVCDPDGGGCPTGPDGTKLTCEPSQLLPTGYFTCK